MDDSRERDVLDHDLTLGAPSHRWRDPTDPDTQRTYTKKVTILTPLDEWAPNRTPTGDGLSEVEVFTPVQELKKDRTGSGRPWGLDLVGKSSRRGNRRTNVYDECCRRGRQGCEGGRVSWDPPWVNGLLLVDVPVRRLSQSLCVSVRTSGRVGSVRHDTPWSPVVPTSWW